jgi:hypothetical protein
VSQLVEFPGPDGHPILVEVEPAGGPVTRGGHREEIVTRAGDSLEQVLGGLGPAVSGIVSRLRESAEWPQEVEVEFSVKLSTDANVIIAKTGGEAHFRILLRWSGKARDG